MNAMYLRQVYRAVRKGVQDAAVKLLTNVDAGQLAVFNEVRTPSCCWCSLYSPTLVELLAPEVVCITTNC